jgi:pimeloyl-ACP methyl ester carboxylesterase
MIDKGCGTPIVLIPGLQGRWEWMRATVDALAEHHRVISFSLCDERTSPFPCDPQKGFGNFLDQVEVALDRAGLHKAVLAGVSYGGLIAAEFAARHPERVSALVLASALHTTWQPNAQQRRFLKAPRLLSPLFVATAPRRMNREVAAAIPTVIERLRFKAGQALLVARAFASPSRMARRVKWASEYQFSDPRTIEAPSLIVTGEAELDRIVPVEVTRRYVDELRRAEHVVLEHTGHIGVVTRPVEFANVLGRFVDAVRLPA